jgi:hypothetical protein
VDKAPDKDTKNKCKEVLRDHIENQGEIRDNYEVTTAKVMYYV